jgi:hydroxymethylpyrimidine pyrophosphatase-like HAD family hydrolase
VASKCSSSRSQPYYLDITNLAANKGEAVIEIARHFGVPLSRVAVIGDMANDLPMFRRAGYAVAMGNATDEVKGEAAAVTARNTEDGFAQAVERFILPRVARGGSQGVR